MTDQQLAFQDQIDKNHCFGCGPDNPQGLKIKSYWLDTDVSECRFTPESHHCAGPTKYLNGGITATIIDCHCVCTAMAKAYQMAGHDIGAGEKLWFATAALEVAYQRPVAIDQEVILTAEIEDASDNKISINCTLSSQGNVCATSYVLAVKVPGNW